MRKSVKVILIYQEICANIAPLVGTTWDVAAIDIVEGVKNMKKALLVILGILLVLVAGAGIGMFLKGYCGKEDSGYCDDSDFEPAEL
jgi:hypothetical protein